MRVVTIQGRLFYDDWGGDLSIRTARYHVNLSDAIRYELNPGDQQNVKITIEVEQESS